MLKNLIIQSKEGKKNGRRISKGRMVLNLMIKQVVINLHTKYEHSSAHSCIVVIDEKCHSSKYGWKENWTNTRKNKQEKAGSQSHDPTCHHQPAYQI